MAEGTTIGYMLQHDLLLEWKTVMENCLLGLKLQKQKTQDNVNFIISLLKEYGLYDFRNKKPSELSGGMKQRCALIRTIALNPDLLLLDESFSALDTQTRMIVSNDISNIIRIKQKTAILVTHDPEEALTLADRVFVLSKRPATITKEIAIHYDIPRTDPVAIRQTPEFQKYRKILWSNLLS